MICAKRLARCPSLTATYRTGKKATSTRLLRLSHEFFLNQLKFRNTTLSSRIRNIPKLRLKPSDVAQVAILRPILNRPSDAGQEAGRGPGGPPHFRV